MHCASSCRHLSKIGLDFNFLSMCLSETGASFESDPFRRNVGSRRRLPFPVDGETCSYHSFAPLFLPGMRKVYSETNFT